ncbi:MAG: DUF4317 domain-containing protein [Lachnospiraceae bacterium]|nr:DUF4317 domain-containing protein [Lachnospiraceae bacterium]
MIRADIKEIKKQLTPDRCTIDRICGCYVNHEKKKIFTSTLPFGMVPDEEMYKYLDVFRHTLSGITGKNLISLAFSAESEKKGSPHDLLMRLRESALSDEVLLDTFYDAVIEAYDFGENYYIVLVHAIYDVPTVTSDRQLLTDASENVYEYILCAICPVVLSKAALGYDEHKNLIVDRFRDWIVDMPSKGFLFPAFSDRTADIHEMLYYTRRADDMQPALIDLLFGAQEVLSAPEQLDGFRNTLQKTLADHGDFETMQNLHENLHRMIEEHPEEEGALTIDKKGLKKLLNESGIDSHRLRSFDKHFEESFHREDYPLLAENIASEKRFEMKGPDIKVIVNPDRADLVTTRVIDGKQCLVIQIDDHVEVNGISVRTLKKP